MGYNHILTINVIEQTLISFILNDLNSSRIGVPAFVAIL